MKRRRGGGRRFRAMQRRRRMDGDLGPDQDASKESDGAAGFPRPIRRLPDRPWRRIDHFDTAWKHEDRPRLVHHVSRDLGLYLPGTRQLDPLRVTLVTKEEVSNSSGFRAYELALQYRIGKELAPLVRRGEMTWAEFDREYDRFVNDTLPNIRRRVIPQVMGDLRQQAGLDAPSRGGSA